MFCSWARVFGCCCFFFTWIKPNHIHNMTGGFLHIHRPTRVRHRRRNNFLHMLHSHGVTKKRQIHLTQKWWLLYAFEKCVHIKIKRECENTCERGNMENQVKRETNFSFGRLVVLLLLLMCAVFFFFFLFSFLLLLLLSSSVIFLLFK